MKNSFLFYHDYENHFNLIENDTEYRLLMEGIISYSKTGIKPKNLSPIASMLFSVVSTNIDRDAIKYNQMVEKNRQNAKKRWHAVACGGSECMPDKSSHAVDADIDIGIGIDKGIKSKETKTIKYTEDFEQFWQAYPNKKGGKKATAVVYKRAVDKPEIEQLLNIISFLKKCSEWVKDGGQFIPMASTWLNQGRWTDVEDNRQQANKQTQYN